MKRNYERWDVVVQREEHVPDASKKKYDFISLNWRISNLAVHSTLFSFAEAKSRVNSSYVFSHYTQTHNQNGTNTERVTVFL